jgi:hypothetical protein
MLQLHAADDQWVSPSAVSHRANETANSPDTRVLSAKRGYFSRHIKVCRLNTDAWKFFHNK